MNFMAAYKRLDNLCKDMNEIGISGYIEELDSIKAAENYQQIFEDLKMLKHYRWVRNQIAHEINYDEEELYDENDITWLTNFYDKIIKQEDSYYIYRQNKTTNSLKKEKSNNITKEKLNNRNKKDKVETLILIIILIILLVIIFTI